jgi:hypothetical protein
MKSLARTALESAVLILGLLAFWPAVIGYTGLWYQLGLLLVLASLIVLMLVQVSRVRRGFAAAARHPDSDY